MNKIFCLALLLVSSIVGAEEYINLKVDHELTEDQKAQLVIKANELANESSKTTNVTRVKEYVDVGLAIGEGLATSASKVGVAANEFANTPVGKVTVFLIAWHYFGNQMVGVIFSFLWFGIMIPVWIFMFRRLVYNKIIYYDKDTGKKTQVTKSNNFDDSNTQSAAIVYWITLVAIVVVGLVVLF